MISSLTIIVIRENEDVNDCDLAILKTEDQELIKKAKKHSKFVLLLGEKSKDESEFTKFISCFELLNSIIERIPEPIVVHDTQRILYANPVAKKLISSEGLKLKVADFIHPEYRSIAFQRMQRVLRGERVEPLEELFRMPDGREIWVETIPTLINFEGKPAILLLLRDLTERKRVEEKYRDFFQNSLDIIVVTDLEGNCVEVNRAFEEAFGYTSAEVVGKNFAEVLRLERDLAEKIFESYNKALREKRDLKGLLFEVKRKDGRRIIVEGNIRLLWSRGRIVGFVGNYRDVTERIQLERKLKESEERYRKIFENSPTLIGIVDERGVFVEANPAMVRSVGTNPIGKSHFELFSKEVAERRSQNLLKAIEKNTVIDFEDEREGRYFINYYIPIELEGKRHCLIISQEITELLRLNKFLRLIIEVNEAMTRIRDKETLIKKVEEILSEYSARFSDQPSEFCFRICYEGKEYGYLCVNVEKEEEIKLIETLAENLGFAFRAIESERRKEELYEKLAENIRTIAYLVDGIRNPLAALRAYAETLIEEEGVREKILKQVDRIVEIVKKLDLSWNESEKIWKRSA